MSRYACHRCDWAPEADDAEPPRSQLSGHARDAEHPLCIICGLSLHDEEPQTCLPCMSATRKRLEEILDLYAMLPGLLGHPKAPRMDPLGGSGSDEQPVPGGDALVMLSGGSEGRWAQGEAHNADHQADDAPSVAFELSRWEDIWREERGEGAADYVATVTSATTYLGSRLTWAAGAFPAFDEFAEDIRRLHSRLVTATATGDRPETGAPCFDCGADLQRGYREPKPCEHERPTQSLTEIPVPDGYEGPAYLETVRDRDARLAAWGAEHAHCDAGGLVEDWTCPRCRRVYTQAEYWLAVRAQLEAS